MTDSSTSVTPHRAASDAPCDPSCEEADTTADLCELHQAEYREWLRQKRQKTDYDASAPTLSEDR
jgi:hypothetical protein